MDIIGLPRLHHWSILIMKTVILCLLSSCSATSEVFLPKIWSGLYIRTCLQKSRNGKACYIVLWGCSQQSPGCRKVCEANDTVSLTNKWQKKQRGNLCIKTVVLRVLAWIKSHWEGLSKHRLLASSHSFSFISPGSGPMNLHF